MMDDPYWRWFEVVDFNSSDCQDVHDLTPDTKCAFVKTAPDCLQEGYFNYTIFCYCTLGGNLVPLALTILFLFWLLLFVALAVCADDFFCPSLHVIARTLRMSDNIAGVTLLAFGNGAPDVFSAIAAVKKAKDGDVGMALGALLGAGIFVTTVVAGAITMVTSFHVMERPFLRDVVFYIGSVCVTFYVIYDGKITLAESIGFILIYVFYVIVVVVGRIVYQKYKERVKARERQPATIQSPPEGVDDASRSTSYEDRDGTAVPNGNAVFSWRPDYGLTGNGVPNGGSGHRYRRIPGGEDYYVAMSEHVLSDVATYEWAANDSDLDSDILASSTSDSEDSPLLDDSLSDEPHDSAIVSFLKAICPLDHEDWVNSRCFVKPYLIFKCVPLLVLRLTIPVVDITQHNNNWNKYLNTLHCLISPFIGLFLANSSYALYEIGDVFPVWAVLLLVGLALSIVVMCTSCNYEPPVYHWVFAYVGFLVAVVWIQAIASEIVNLLQTFGVVLDISNAVLGLTFLAWGNSIGDLVADVVMAKQGAPRAGISACFGGPLFNLLMGIGIPFTMGCAASGDYQINFTLISVVLVSALLFSLVSSLICLPLMKFTLNRKYGIYLFVVYVVFLTLAVLVETGVIKGKVYG